MDEQTTNPSSSDGWTPQRGRLLGALIEKALATPQNYPLTLNSLAAACNQTTNRDPITALTESELERLLDQAKADGLARFVHPRSGRGVTKFKHVVDEAFELGTDELALVGVLLLRGPQTVSELRTRTERLAGLADNETTEAVLHRLAERESGPLVQRLGREPGSRERRWIQLLCPAQGRDRASGIDQGFSPTHEEPATSTPTPKTGDVQAELSELRQQINDLRQELADLRAGFDELRSELGG